MLGFYTIIFPVKCTLQSCDLENINYFGEKKCVKKYRLLFQLIIEARSDSMAWL